MRIALVATGGFDGSGRERVIPNLVWFVERLARNHRVVVYVLRYHDTPRRYELRGATIVDLGRPEGYTAQRSALLHAMRADGPFDVVHAYWAQPAGRLVALAARTLDIPSVITFDSGEFASIPSASYGLQSGLRGRLAVRLAGRLATRTTVCSEFQARLAHAHGLNPAVIPIGVDTTLFSRRTAAPSGPPYRLLHVASLNPVKDQQTLLRAFSELRRQALDVTLDIVGEDTLEGRLQAQARDLGIDDRVTFHGFLASDALVPLYHAAHLFVLTSLHEAAGVVLLEAAACGVPVVGSRVGYLSDWAMDRAVTVPPRAPEPLAAAIAALLADDARRAGLAERAANWARLCNADWTAREFETLYAEAIRTRPPQSAKDWLRLAT
jgi:glycosyltransferase involved in cell wall biosynthesis